MKILENRELWTKEYQQGWLTKLETTGEIDWRIYPRPQNEHAPGGPGVRLQESRLMLISSAGAYLGHDQQPFDAASPTGDYTMRAFPSDTRFQDLIYAHDHYDHAMVDRDPQVALPLDHLQEMVADGRLGSMTPSVVSFMGYQPDAARVVDELVPQVLDKAKNERAEAALLAPV